MLVIREKWTQATISDQIYVKQVSDAQLSVITSICAASGEKPVADLLLTSAQSGDQPSSGPRLETGITVKHREM